MNGLFSEKRLFQTTRSTHTPQTLEFMNFNGIQHSCSKYFNYLANCKHMLQKEKKKSASLSIWWLWCLTTKSWRFCQLSVAVEQQGSRHTHSVRSGANLRGSLHWPWPDKVPVDKTSFISSCCCSMGAEAATNQLKDSRAKRWKPRSAELQAWSKGMRPGLEEAAELIGPAARLW